LAERYAAKLDYISPVWYQLKHHGEGRVSLQGAHDHDAEWMARVREASATTVHTPMHEHSTHTPTGGASARIVPRFLFDGWQEADFRALMRRRTRSTQVASLLREHCETHLYDGVVLDAGYLPFLRTSEALFLDFFTRVSAELHRVGLTVILVLPPPSAHPQSAYSVEIYRRLEPLFDHLQVMSYDFSSRR
jgi:spore germination protein YaaH